MISIPVDVKGNVKYNPDADTEYTLECRQLGISESGSGVIENDIEDLRNRVINAFSEEFHVPPESVQITGYNLSLSFAVTGPTNYTLDQFAKSGDPEKTEEK